LRQNAAKHALKSGFSSLPTPLNDFEVEMPDDDQADYTEEGHELSVEDAAERDARIKRRQEEEERRALARRSIVVQRGLPRPAIVQVPELLAQLRLSELNEVDALIDAEFVRLLEHDSIAHPLPGTSRPGSTRSTYEHPDDAAVAAARAEVQAELARSLGFPESQAIRMTEEEIKQGVLIAVKEDDVDHEQFGWAKIRAGLVYDAQRRTWVERDSLSEEQRVAGLAALLQEERDLMTSHAAKAAKIEKKTSVMLAGYQARSTSLGKRLTDAFAELRNQGVDLSSFERLSVNESATGPRRIAALQEEVARLEGRERLLQIRYAELDGDKREITARLRAKEERLMDEAEAVNEAALAALDEV
jgi:pre-mRNA-splicing factor CDC5/CEF1